MAAPYSPFSPQTRFATADVLRVHGRNIVCRMLAAAFVVTLTVAVAPSVDAQDQSAEQTPAETADAPAVGNTESAAQESATDAPPEEAGQADLDEAMVLRIDADSPDKLEEVAAMIESALTKGLSDESKSFAKKMLASIQLERGQSIAAELMQGGGRRLRQMRIKALESLRSAIESDPSLVEAYMLIGRLNLLPEGDAEEVRKAATKAIELLADDPAEQSDAYLLRALRQDDDKDKLSDLDNAVRTDPSSSDARQARALLRLQNSDVNGAVEDLQALLKQDPTNVAVAQAAVEQLVQIDRVDDALTMLTDALQSSPNEGLYRLRGIIYRTKGKEDEAMEDFGKALAMQPKDPISLLQRAEISLARKDVKSAKRDLKEAVRVAPEAAESVAAIRVRCYIAAEEGRMADAINDMKLLVANAPDDAFWQLQLANLYLQDKRPKQAIEIANSIISKEPKNVSALRLRADTLLGMGDHAGAVKDYERAIDGGIDDATQRSGVLNNLAWILATSPKEGVRDGDRALKFGNEAAELTEFKEAHILSTLAAAYAEKGNFEEAVKWSTKAVELGKAEENEQIEQLENELKSYLEGKPWREEQETKENNVPLLGPEDLIDT